MVEQEGDAEDCRHSNYLGTRVIPLKVRVDSRCCSNDRHNIDAGGIQLVGGRVDLRLATLGS